ncbi:MAG: hypothetical protein ABS76_29220 [Pelagibacterium sp. SCN 64-44]|nr:MAG: hypothetical protein ABS76_29220 [Pelagibacterium sp. SCN 64-44]
MLSWLGLLMIFLFKLIRRGAVLGALGVASLALMGLFGFVVPEFDLFNHLQVLLFAGGALGLVVVWGLLAGKARRLAVLYVLAGLAASSIILVPEMLGGLAPRPPAPASGTLTMMTHNVFGRNYDMQRVAQAIHAANPDIVVLQEYFDGQAVDLHPLLVGDYPYFVRCRGGKRANLGLYSRLPIVQDQDGACPDDAYGTIRTAHILAHVMLADGRSFSVMTTHIDWPFPVARQDEQLQALSGVLAGVDEPVILAGDFNSTPWSYALRGFASANGLHRETLNLPTFPMIWYYLGGWRNMLPFLPLDHVMTRGGISVHSLGAGLETGSDHLPVVFTFSVE